MLLLKKVHDHTAAILHIADVGPYSACAVMYMIQFYHRLSCMTHDCVHVRVDLFHNEGRRVPH